LIGEREALMATAQTPATEPRLAPGAARSRATARPPAGEGRGEGGRFEELEAYRGVAALLIVLFHVYQYSRQATGADRYVYEGTPAHAVLGNLEATVAWFFVLSGFLIFLPFARSAVERRRAPSPRGFLIRRMIRVLPAYYLAILLVWTWRYAGLRAQRVDLLEHLTFTHIFDRRYVFWTIGPAWSLAVEVLFYLFAVAFGALATVACARLATPRARAALLAGVIALLGLASVAYKAWAAYLARIPRDDSPAYFGPAAKLDTLALGMLLAVAVAATGGRPLVRGAVPSLLRASGLALVAVAFHLRERDSGTPVDLYFHTLNGVAFALLLASTVLGPRGSAWERLLAHPALQFLGVSSYSVYLWHEPLMIELGTRGLLVGIAPDAFPRNALVVAVLSLAAGAASHRALERPALELRHLFTREGRLAARYPEERRG
jgi:peptidoglycan/LPS O-acetylase OafA/YrhL